MTEAEWLACTEPGEMLPTLLPEVSDRKLRLFACAALQRIWSVLVDERVRTAIEVATQWAADPADRPQFVRAIREARAAYNETDDNSIDEYAIGVVVDVVGTEAYPSAHAALRVCDVA